MHRTFTIGPHRFENNLILAPMAGISDRPFRALCRRLGAGLAVAEMVSSNTSSLGYAANRHGGWTTAGEAGPVSAQIVGADPLDMAEAARVNVDLGADIVDINMGCPAKKVCKRAAGSALLRDERLVGADPGVRGRGRRGSGDLEDPHRLVARDPQCRADCAHRSGERDRGPDRPRAHPRLQLRRAGRVRHDPRHPRGGDDTADRQRRHREPRTGETGPGLHRRRCYHDRTRGPGVVPGSSATSRLT
jgi:hypothetical protein